MSIEISPQIEARIMNFARQEGIEPSALIEKLVEAYRPPVPVPPVYTAENDPLMARLEAAIAQAPTDPDEIREAEEDLLEFMRNMNANRRAVGGRIPYPDIE